MKTMMGAPESLRRISNQLRSFDKVSVDAANLEVAKATDRLGQEERLHCCEGCNSELPAVVSSLLHFAGG